MFSRGRLRAIRQKVLFGAILSSYIAAMLKLATDISLVWAELRLLADILTTQDINVEINTLPAFLSLICDAYNVCTLQYTLADKNADGIPL
jgi:hypothetical protein